MIWQMCAKQSLLGTASELKTVDGPGWGCSYGRSWRAKQFEVRRKANSKGVHRRLHKRQSRERLTSHLTPTTKDFCFASFIPNEMPHLTTDSNFNANDARTSPLAGNPISQRLQSKRH